MKAKRVVAMATTAAMLLMTAPQPARAGGVVIPIPATEFTQILNNIELISQYIQQGQQFAQQIQQYQTQIQQFANEVKMATTVGPQFFSNVTRTLTGLQQVVQGGNALSYSMANMDSQFTSKFAQLGYAPTTSFASRYSQWSTTSMANTQKSLDAANLQSSNLTNEAQLVSSLQSMSQSTTGTLEALQTGNQIAAEQVNQLMELRQLMMADMQSKASFQASQISQQDEANRSVGFFSAQKLYNNWQ